MKILPGAEIAKQPGYIYLVRLNGMFKTTYKIGKTRSIKRRLETLSCQTGLKVILIAYGYTIDSTRTEQRILNLFYDNQIHGEYFQFNGIELISVIKAIGSICDCVITDYSDPVCPNDGKKLKIGKYYLECSFCNYKISNDIYLQAPDRMLPYAVDFMDDDYTFGIDRVNHIFNWDSNIIDVEM